MCVQLKVQELDCGLPWGQVSSVPSKVWLQWETLLQNAWWGGQGNRAGEGPCGWVVKTYSQKPGTKFPFCYLSCLCVCVYMYAQSCPTLFNVTPRTAAHQALLSMGFPRQEYWSGLPFPTPGDAPRDQTHMSCISCIGRQILYHWAIMPIISYKSFKARTCLSASVNWR